MPLDPALAQSLAEELKDVAEGAEIREPAMPLGTTLAQSIAEGRGAMESGAEDLEVLKKAEMKAEFLRVSEKTEGSAEKPGVGTKPWRVLQGNGDAPTTASANAGPKHSEKQDYLRHGSVSPNQLT